MRTDQDTVVTVWCRLTGRAEGEFEIELNLSQPEVAELARTPYPDLLEAAITAARQGCLPLANWLACVHELQSASPAGPQPAGDQHRLAG